MIWKFHIKGASKTLVFWLSIFILKLFWQVFDNYSLPNDSVMYDISDKMCLIWIQHF